MENSKLKEKNSKLKEKNSYVAEKNSDLVIVNQILCLEFVGLCFLGICKMLAYFINPSEVPKALNVPKALDVSKPLIASCQGVYFW